jgi:hypothetical protein
VLTGVIGVVIDAVTGGWSALSPEAATVSLTKTAMIDGPDKIDVVVKIDRGKNAVQTQSTEPGVRVRVVPTQ